MMLTRYLSFGALKAQWVVPSEHKRAKESLSCGQLELGTQRHKLAVGRNSTLPISRIAVNWRRPSPTVNSGILLKRQQTQIRL